MKIKKFMNKNGVSEYHFMDYNDFRDFLAIHKIIKKTLRKRIKDDLKKDIQYIEKFNWVDFEVRYYKFLGSKIKLYWDSMYGIYLTVEKKEEESALEILVRYLEKLEIG